MKTSISGYGENLYWSSRVLVGEENAVFGTAAVTSWYGESADWNYATSSGAAGKVTGHFTQVSKTLECGGIILFARAVAS